MIFQLRDIEVDVVKAWTRHFKGLDDVVVSNGDIGFASLRWDALVPGRPARGHFGSDR
jgi:hypothetical protein